MRFLPLSVAFVALLFRSPTAHATGFEAWLQVTDGKQTQSAHSGMKPDSAAASHRRTLETSGDGPFTAKWKVTRTDAVEAKDVLVHFYVVKLDRAGQSPPALEPSKVPIESALTMDFANGKTSTGSQQFRVEPGLYLVRIEAGGDPDKPGQEDFAELELLVK